MAEVQVDDSAAGAATLSGGGSLNDFIDEQSLTAEVNRAATRNRATARPFRQYQKRVIELAGVPNVQAVREMTSNICGAVARLPFVPDAEAKDAAGQTEFDLQVVRTAQRAEEQLDSEMIWTAAAQKLARAALDLRLQDPDGSKGIAWVNDLKLEEGASVLDV